MMPVVERGVGILDKGEFASKSRCCRFDKRGEGEILAESPHRRSKPASSAHYDDKYEKLTLIKVE